MKGKISICLLLLGLVVGLCSCAETTEKENMEETVSPTAIISQAVFAPAKEKVEEKVEGITGLAEVLEQRNAFE